ncbi:MAG: tRNA glutamyl-Q(34) synthetase GluQRS, partial [Hyphomicrobiales bacterium]|nr:tRNA glutamyl-Q(34) synthetase GluQRS [Hyphomicrobiales bacterium]
IDHTRARPQFEQAIYEDLAWLGVTWPSPVWRQSEHMNCYAAVLQRLEALGLLYPCFCTRNEIHAAVSGKEGWPRDPDGTPIYPGACRHLDQATRRALRESGKPAAMRLDMENALTVAERARQGAAICWREFGEGETGQTVRADAGAWGDVVLARKDIGVSYHVAVVADDHAQGITDIIRGQDLYAATSIHRLLQVLLGLREPNYRHHRLLRDESDKKLSKSARAKSLRSLRAEGWSSERIKQELQRCRTANTVATPADSLPAGNP